MTGGMERSGTYAEKTFVGHSLQPALDVLIWYIVTYRTWARTSCNVVAMKVVGRQPHVMTDVGELRVDRSFDFYKKVMCGGNNKCNCNVCKVLPIPPY